MNSRGDPYSACPTEECWCAYAAGELAGRSRERLAHHLSLCRICFARLAAVITALRTGARYAHRLAIRELLGKAEHKRCTVHDKGARRSRPVCSRNL